MRGFSFRLTHKIVAIGIVGIAGVMLVGGIHVYGESEMAVYRDTAENAQTISELSSKIEIELLEGMCPVCGARLKLASSASDLIGFRLFDLSALSDQESSEQASVVGRPSISWLASAMTGRDSSAAT